MRATWSVVRWAVVAVGCLGAAASLRVAIAPPAAPVVRVPSGTRPDLAAQTYAASFARAYLTWNAARPERHSAALAPFVGENLDPDAGLTLPSRGANTVTQAETVQERAGDADTRVYTVAARTSRLGTVYLSVTVRRTAGQLQIVGFPSLVGAPQSTAAAGTNDGDARPVSDGAVRAVSLRALTNYLADAGENLRADLAPGANVALPGLGLRVIRLDDLGWAPGGGAVEATVEASRQGAPTFTLRYELDLTWQGGRPLIQAIQMDPTT